MGYVWRWLLSLLAALLAGAVIGGCARVQAVRPTSAAPMLERDTTVTGRRMSYGLHLTPQSNLIYQLDCIAGVIICARPIYREFWTHVGLDADDEAALATWKALRARHGGELKRLDRSIPLAVPRVPLLVPSGAGDLGERQRIAGLVSRTPAAYQASIALLSTDGDARQLGRLLDRFAPRFTRWWQARGFPAGSASFDEAARSLADPILDSIIERAAHFYEAELPEGPALEVYLMVQPASQRRLTTAHQLEGYAAVDAPEGAKAAAYIDVVAHELFHYFFSRMQPEPRATLLGRVCASDDPLAAASFGVLDEALAATLGNGVVGRHYVTPEAFARRLARDTGLDRYRAASLVARALLPSMEGFLDRGVTVSSGEFLRVYLAAAHAMYERGAPRPLDYLHSHVSVADPRFAAATQRLQEASNAGYPYLREYGAWSPEAKDFVVEHPLVSAAVFLGSDERPGAVLEALGAGPQDLGNLGRVAGVAQRVRGLVYGLRRTPKSYAFVFLARDPPAMDELVARFVELGGVGEGVLVELPQ